MRLYAESSAVLAWLLRETSGLRAGELLASAKVVIASELTLVECDRALIRGVALGEISDVGAAERQAVLNAIVARWTLLPVGPEIVARARQPFPGEPLRALDALHLASALAARSAVADLIVLSLDRRLRAAAAHSGFRLQPD